MKDNLIVLLGGVAIAACALAIEKACGGAYPRIQVVVKVAAGICFILGAWIHLRGLLQGQQAFEKDPDEWPPV